VTDVPVFLAEM